LHHRFLPAGVLAAGVTLAAVTLTAASATPGPAPGSQPTVPAGPRPVFTLNGGLAAPAPGGPPTQCLIVDNTEVVVPGLGGQVQSLRAGSKNYLVPVVAVPYLGRGLDPALFDPAALARAETGGRLPVRLGFTGGVPHLPGVTITRAGTGTADGYLTQAGAVRFGQALARQFTADHARDSYGQDGLFAGGVTVRLPGPAARPGSPKRFPMHTVTVSATNLAGKPDTGNWVWLINADDANRFDDLVGASLGVFDNGFVKFSVPPGHYWVVAQFASIRGAAVDLHIVTRPQVTVGSHTTVHLDERSATSQITMVTPRPATVKTTDLDLVRHSAAGPASGLEWFLQTLPQGGANGRIFVAPAGHQPMAGSLSATASEDLRSPAGAHGIPYQYWLSYAAHGQIPPERHVVKPASLATVDARYYSAKKGTQAQAYDPLPSASARGCGTIGDTDFAISVPSRRTVYLNGGQSVRWLGSGAQQEDSGRSVSPGQRLADNWGAYPIHPVPDVRMPGAIGVSVASAARSGNKLGLNWWVFGDNQPGHHNGEPFASSGSYQIDQNGTKISGGTLPKFSFAFSAGAALAPGPSVLRLTLDLTADPAVLPLSRTTHTVWVWRSAPPAPGELPNDWTCPKGLTGRSCAVEPLMTLNYTIGGLGLDESAPAGAQSVTVNVGHLQLAKAARVTGARVSVSFDGGKTWHPAKVTGSDSTYRAVFQAPAGATVSLRTSATDAAGGSITQTILGAYRTAS
jgi:hypothetical protein